MMSFSFALLYVLGTFVKSIDGINSSELHFTSTSCEKPLDVSLNKGYNLTWDGRITPKLCNFTFNRQSNVSRICFESTIFDLQYSMGDVEVKIQNNTKSKWDYDRYYNRIPRRCVKNAYKLMVSILVPTGYIEPNPRIYIELEITGVQKTSNGETDEGSNTSIGPVTGTSAMFFFVFIVFCIASSGRNSSGGRLECIGGITECCRKCLCECKCLHECNTASCDCKLHNLCQSCGKLCTTWAKCCTPQHRVSNVRTEETLDVQHNSTDIVLYSPASRTNYMIAEEPPPSYESVKDRYKTIDPTLPPPSYDEVTSQTVSSAPRNIIYM